MAVEMRAKPLAAALLVLGLITAFTGSVAAFEGGTGTENDPYQISTCMQLQDVQNDITAHYELINDIDCTDTENWNNGTGFKPIAPSNDFTGSLNGDYHKVTSLSILDSSRGRNALFNQIGSGAVVENLHLKNAYIEGGSNQGAGIVALQNDGKIQNTYFNGTITGSSDDAGGIVGYQNGGVIRESYTSGNINGVTAGGVVGFQKGNVSNTYTKAYVSGTTIGGITGNLYSGNIKKSYAAGSLGSADNSGGITGYSGGTGSDNYWNNEKYNAGIGGTSSTGSSLNTTSLTTSEMTYPNSQTNMEGLDFQNIWSSCSGVNNDYPYFKWSYTCNSAPKIVDTDYEPENPMQSDTVYLMANVSDPDNNLDTVTATVTESGTTVLNNSEMTLDLNTGLYETSFNVTAENSTYTVTYTATDTEGATDTTQETIALPLNNDDPELGNLSRTPENPKIYDSLSFYGEASDSDTNLAGLNFTLTRNSETVVHRELSGSGIYDLNDIATAEPGSYTVKYVAYDAKGSTDTKTQSFTVEDPTTGVSITLRDAPITQSFSSIQSTDSHNVTVENGSVKENGTDATYVTQQINSGQFDLAAVHMSGSGSIEVMNLTGNETTAITQDLVSGANTVDLSELDTQKIRLKVKLDTGSEITGLQVYGEDYSGGWFGGIVGPTGGFLSDVPVVGEFLNGVATGISNAVNAVLSIPQQMLEGILEVLPTL